MVQHISNTRTDKQLTVNDLARISYASCLNFFHTNSMFSPWPFGIYYVAHFYYVKRLNKDSYMYQKSYGATNSYYINARITNVSTITTDQVKAMHQDLVCSRDGEERVCIDVNYGTFDSTNKNKLGFFILDPNNIHEKSVDGRTNNFCIYQLIITPKTGLFPVNK